MSSDAAKPAYITDNIIIGNGEVPAIKTAKGIEYVLPGGQRTQDRSLAERFASRLDRIVSANLLKFRRKLYTPC